MWRALKDCVGGAEESLLGVVREQELESKTQSFYCISLPFAMLFLSSWTKGLKMSELYPATKDLFGTMLPPENINYLPS